MPKIIVGILFCVFGLQAFGFNDFRSSRIVGSFRIRKSQPLRAENSLTTDAEPQSISNSISCKFSRLQSMVAIGVLLTSTMTKSNVNAACKHIIRFYVP